MYDMREVDGAIAELENSEPTMQRVEKLAALYIVKNQHQAKPEPIAAEPIRYYAAAEAPQKAVVQGSDFLQAVAKIDTDAALAVLDELMTVLSATNPRAYSSVMRKLEKLRD